MLALLLIGALVAQALGAPTDCTELCDDVNGGYSSSGGQAHSSYRSYAKSGGSYGSSQRLQQRLGSARLENLDENVISPSAERPGSWQNEKHYVTDDGHGQMHYREGQTVTDNGYSKFAEHSYSYGSHDSHAARANSQILSTAEFNSEIQNMRNRIASFMGKYNVNAGSVVSANIIADFKDRAETITGQLANVCNQVDIGSSMYQQMQDMQRQFQKDVERLQHQMEQQLIIQTSSSSSSSSSHIVHGSMHYPSSSSSSIQPSYVPATAAPAEIQFAPSSQVTEENIAQQQHLEQEISQVSTQIYTFYNSFTNVEASSEYKKNFNDQVDAIHQKLIDLKLQAIQYNSLRQRIENDMAHFETYVGQLRARIQQEEEREFEERRRKLEAEEQAQKERFESYQREIEAKKLQVQQEAENLRKQHEAQLRREQEAAELLKIQEAAEKLRLEQLETRRRQAEMAHKAEQLRLQQQQEEQRLQEQLHQQQQLAFQRQMKAKQQQQEEAARVEVVQPQASVSGHHVKVSGSASYESVVNSYGGQGTTTSSTGSYARPTMNAHVDLTAVTSRLQRELNRLQNEINNFNTYTMRLTAANSQSVIGEAERQAELLRQNINNLCETSGRYHNQNVQTSAEELSRRFEEMFRSLQSQAANYTAQGGSSAGFSASAGYSSHSSYGSSGVVSSVRQPTITNVEYEHSKSAEVEISRRPISASSSQRYAHGQVDCVEAYAGQPCVQQQSYRRYRRQVGGK